MRHSACRLRLRPIIMTSLAFTLGVVPLYLATGAGAEMRIALAVFWGMIGVTLFGLMDPANRGRLWTGPALRRLRRIDSPAAFSSTSVWPEGRRPTELLGEAPREERGRGETMFTRHAAIAAVLSAATILIAAEASAQTFPDRPVNLIVMAPAGGATDVGARIVASIAEKSLGQPIIVLNRAGAGGQVAWTELARSKPDGYTIGTWSCPE